jgi:hypothetical protein
MGRGYKDVWLAVVNRGKDEPPASGEQVLDVFPDFKIELTTQFASARLCDARIDRVRNP